MRNLKGYLLITGLIILVPLIGIIVGSVVSHGFEKQYEDSMIQIIKEKNGIDISDNLQFLNKIKLENLCEKNNLDPTFSTLCGEYNSINNITYASILTIIFTILIFIFIYILGLFSQKSRSILFYLFRPGLFIAQISAALLVAANAGIIIFSIYFTESFYLGKVHIFLIGGLGLVAALTAIVVFIKAFTPIKSAESKVLGKILSKDHYPTIWNYIKLLAEQVGTKQPDTIIAGLEPTFFVTETKVRCLDGEVNGRSLFISLPFCRAISKAELSAIIGHEMGHFIGDDTKWSKKFYPIYRGSIDTTSSLNYSDSDNGLAQIAFLPSLIFMTIFIAAFEKSEKSISRQRELNADSIGTKITSKENMATALIKSHIYQYIWNFTQEMMKEALSQGNQIINISTYFATICESIPSDFMKDEIGKSHTIHPTDSHPTLAVRLDSIGVKLHDVYSDKIKKIDTEKAIELIDNVEILEKELSDIEHYKLVQTGQINIPSQLIQDNK